jgi:hypothetical protein
MLKPNAFASWWPSSSAHGQQAVCREVSADVGEQHQRGDQRAFARLGLPRRLMRRAARRGRSARAGLIQGYARIRPGTWTRGNGAGWHLVGTGDHNGDGKSHILMQNSASGGIWQWLMNGNQIMASNSVGNPGTSWPVA